MLPTFKRDFNVFCSRMQAVITFANIIYLNIK